MPIHQNISKWIFKDIRGKLIFLPDGPICKKYCKISPPSHVQIIPPTFFKKCINWNKKNIQNAIDHFVDFMRDIPSIDDAVSYPMVETNVVIGCLPPCLVSKQMHMFLFKFIEDNTNNNNGIDNTNTYGSIHNSKEKAQNNKHDILINITFSRFGMFLLDFCHKDLIEKILYYCLFREENGVKRTNLI